MASLFDGPPATPLQEIGFLLVPEFSNLCFASAMEPLRAANRMAGQTLYMWRLISMSGSAVTSSSGLSIPVESRLSPTDRIPVLFVIASFHPEASWTPELARTLRALRGRGTQFGGLDTGSYLLARSGLLDGYRATIHWEDLDAFAEAFPEVDARPDRYVIDRDRFTAGGGTTSLDLMLHLIRVQHGLGLALDTAGQFIYGHDAPPTDPQHSVSLRQLERENPGLARAIEIMEENLEEILPIAAVATRAGLPQRELERQFRRHLGLPPLRYYMDLRLRLAHRMLGQTKRSVEEIAVRCGFSSSSALARAFRARFGLSPTEVRRGQT
jgi:transcriptional regulator GlxA family with amidase domain